MPRSSPPRQATTSGASSVPSAEAIGPEAYTRWHATALGTVTEALEQRVVLDLAGLVEGARVLDLGCAMGCSHNGDGPSAWTS